MRVVLAARDADGVDWLFGVLSSAGFTVAILSDPGPTSPELKGAELVIADGDCAALLEGAGPARRVLLAARGGTVDLDAVRQGFKDVLVLPSPAEEVVARVRHALDVR